MFSSSPLPWIPLHVLTKDGTPCAMILKFLPKPSKAQAVPHFDLTALSQSSNSVILASKRSTMDSPSSIACSWEGSRAVGLPRLHDYQYPSKQSVFDIFTEVTREVWALDSCLITRQKGWIDMGPICGGNWIATCFFSKCCCKHCVFNPLIVSWQLFF